MLSAFLTAAAVILGAMTLLWLVSVWKRDASIVDLFWGPAFVIVAWVYRLLGAEPGVLRQQLLLALVTLWGLRLGLYLTWRNHGKGEDYRYRQMREKQGDGFWWTSFFRVFLLQGVLVLVISLPYLVVQVPELEPGWHWTTAVGLVLWTAGFLFESIGDGQLARFKADPSNQGKVLRLGLWRYTRHPNYFGDFLVWWGYFAIALGAPHGWWTLPCPLLMSFFLLKVSGVALLEKTIGERRPEYRDYVESTRAFFPWFPKNNLRG